MKKFSKILLALYIIGILCLIGSRVSLANENDENKQMIIYSLNVGEGINGDSTLIESNGEYLLMDIGERASYQYINQFLQEKNITHFSLYFSHFHGDHTGGFSNTSEDPAPMYLLMRDYDIDYIYYPDISLIRYKGEQVAASEEVYYRKAREFYESAIATKEHPENYKSFDEIFVTLKKGDSFSFGDVNANVIGPVGIDDYTSPLKNEEQPISPENTDEDALDDYQNNCSLITKLVCGEISFLTAGDLKTDGENALINEYKDTDILKSTIYKMSHHGLYPANGDEFMSYVRPDFSFVSNYSCNNVREGGKFWEIHTSQVNCNKYGFVYMDGNEESPIQINVNNNNVELYRYGEQEKLNKPGWTVVAGGDGVDRQQEYYYFDENGYTLKGVQKIDNKYYYFGTGGYKHYGVGKGSEYLGMRTCDEDGKKRYFSENDGSMNVGFCPVKDNNYDGVYYFKEDGELLTSSNGDWEKVKIGDNYYGVYSSGKLSISVFRDFGDGMCYFDESGKMLTGWQNIDGATYYLDATTGARYTGLKKIDGNHYLFTDYGKMYTNTFKETDNGMCYFGSDGVMYKGWKNIGSDTYYFNIKNGRRYTGLQKIDNKHYLFSSSGKMYKNTFKETDNGICYFGDDGAMYKGWNTINDAKYYFNSKNGRRYTGFCKIGDYYYIFSDYGKLYTNTFKTANGGLCYFTNSGKMVTGWKTINDKRYYFNLKTGVRCVGLQRIDGYYYYFSDAGALHTSTTKTINDVKYTFDSKGRMTNVPTVKRTVITALKPDSNSVLVKWRRKNADGYQVYMSTSKDGSYSKVATIKDGSKGYRTIKNLKSGTTYYFKVRAYKNVGNYAEYSRFSDVMSVKTTN